MPSSSDNFDYSTYLSPFTIRYGSSQMRQIWSEENRRKLWRNVWVSLAKAEYKAGLVSKKELEDIISHQNDINIEKSRKREEKVYHELMSELQIFSEQCTIGGGKLHLGATSTDILDNATSIQIHESLQLIKQSLQDLLKLFAQKIQQYEDIVCIGYTHLQPAEPTTLGYRFAFYAQDVLIDLETLKKILPLLKTKGLKGAVGTSASFEALLEKAKISPEQLEADFTSSLGVDTLTITHQTYPRKIDLLVIELLANIASSIHKFCFDYRVLQSPTFGEWMEKRNSERVGSSAMPFKRNPDRAEKVCSLCRYVSGFLSVAWSNPANSLLERTLDDSASQRLFLPEAFLAVDDCLKNTKVLVENLEINTVAVAKNLETYGQFSATEPLLMELVKRGASRQTMHEKIKDLSMTAWSEIQKGNPNPLSNLLFQDKEIGKFIKPSELTTYLNPTTHIGLAKKKTKAFVKIVEKNF